VYNTAPPTAGQVTIHTTHGDITIALWSKECALASRNFVQLCLEKYYDGTIFHRVVRGCVGGNSRIAAVCGEIRALSQFSMRLTDVLLRQIVLNSFRDV